MKRLIALTIVTILTAYCLASCGSTTGSTITTNPTPTPTATNTPTPTPSPTPIPPDGYLRVDSTNVRWLQWTEAGGQINGLWTAAVLQNGKISYANGSLIGTQNGQNISLTMSLLGQTVSATGTLVGTTLTLQTPGDNGQLVTVVYHGVRKADYDAALAVFKAAHP